MSSMKNRVGETNIANNGQKMTIIAYRSCSDIDIQFEDGTIVYNKPYYSFKNGDIRNPRLISSSRLGEISTTNTGEKMTIIAYRGCDNIDIQFEDGTIVTNKEYYRFKQGSIKNPNHTNFNVHSRIGEINYDRRGQKMTIIAYRAFDDIDIQFEDGTVVTNKCYSSFERGQISSFIPPIDSSSIANNGLKMTIIAYRGYDDIDIQFEDGITVKNKRYGNFIRGYIQHPNISKGFVGSLHKHILNGLAYRLNNNDVYYYCKCSKCGKKDILNPQQILSHECEYNI